MIEARAPLPPHMANTFKAFGFDPKEAPQDPFAALAGETLR
jgi:hypothetical protein